MTTDDEIVRRLELIEARNGRVEDDKAWETSWVRRLSLTTFIYVVIAVYLRLVIHIDPWINALVPVIGFLLSTTTLSLFKRLWLKHHRAGKQ